ncbi:MAG TPA: antibiotic biosynthesis monooxygenase [Anaerolineaceae bacterium]
MIITILEGRVTSDRWEEFEDAYRKKIKRAPMQLRQSYLIQSTTNLSTWRIISIWRSKEAYEEMSTSSEFNTCVEMFRQVGVEPTRRVFRVVERHEHV